MNEEQPPRRILVLTIVDETNGGNHQIILNELNHDSPPDIILKAVDAVRDAAPRSPSNIIPFPIQYLEQE